VRETFVNDTENYQYGNNEYESDCETTGELFKHLRREHGRCTGKMYIDTKQGETKQTGWVFEKREHYWGAQRGQEKGYIKQTWVSVYRVQVESAFDWQRMETVWI
jgi:glucan-binding YG repeat protein